MSSSFFVRTLYALFALVLFVSTVSVSVSAIEVVYDGADHGEYLHRYSPLIAEIEKELAVQVDHILDLESYDPHQGMSMMEVAVEQQLQDEELQYFIQYVKPTVDEMGAAQFLAKFNAEMQSMSLAQFSDLIQTRMNQAYDRLYQRSDIMNDVMPFLKYEDQEGQSHSFMETTSSQSIKAWKTYDSDLLLVEAETQLYADMMHSIQHGWTWGGVYNSMKNGAKSVGNAVHSGITKLDNVGQKVQGYIDQGKQAVKNVGYKVADKVGVDRKYVDMAVDTAVSMTPIGRIENGLAALHSARNVADAIKKDGVAGGLQAAKGQIVDFAAKQVMKHVPGGAAVTKFMESKGGALLAKYGSKYANSPAAKALLKVVEKNWCH